MDAERQKLDLEWQHFLVWPWPLSKLFNQLASQKTLCSPLPNFLSFISLKIHSSSIKLMNILDKWTYLSKKLLTVLSNQKL